MIPSIPKIQRLIEAAWQKGFDLQGCEQLGGKVVDTTKWIGATEIVATLSSLKVKSVYNTVTLYKLGIALVKGKMSIVEL